MYCISSRLKPGERSNEPAEPRPGPPAIRNIAPRENPAAGRTSTCRATLPGVAPVRSSGAITVAHCTPVLPTQGVRGTAACAFPAPAKTATTAVTRTRRRPTRHARVAVPVYAVLCPVSATELEREVFESVTVIGSG